MSVSYCIVGGGISGLVAAYRLRMTVGPDAAITVFDPADRLGGVLRTERVGGQLIDVGAEAFVARRPEVPALLAELGLTGRQIGTTGARPLIYSQGRLHQMPRDTLNGIPAHASSLAGLVDDATIARMVDERTRPFAWRRGADPAVADLVGDRFGEQVVARSVDPLLAGVYAGSAATIGLRSAVPTLAAALDRGAPNLTDAVREALPPPITGSVFGAVDGGYAVLLDELIRRAGIRWAQVAVERVSRSARRWELVDDEGARWHADAVVLAVPAPRLPALIEDVAPRSAAAARRIEVASTALVALALPGGTPLPEHSGVLVASGERLRAKAITLSSRKWGQRGNVELVRLSFGRFGDRTSPAVPATRICWRGRRGTWPRSSASPSSPSIVMCTGGSTRCRNTVPGTGTMWPRCGRAYLRRWRWPAAIWTASGCRRASPRRPGRRRRWRCRAWHDRAMAKLDFDALNATIRYLMFSVFSGASGRAGREEWGYAIVDETATFRKQQEDNGVVVRGLYYVAGLRADADFMIRTHAETAEALQATYSDFRRTTTLGRAATPVWSSVALHRPAEFNKSHIPAFLAGEEPGAYICVYPFVRSLDWYLLEDEERRRMLAEHGMAARGYKDVRANTVPAFALGDYEWILAFEAPELHRIVDLMRDLRATDARRHVREETPFFTGPRVGVEELVAKLP